MICSGVCRLLPIADLPLAATRSPILTSALISFQGVTSAGLMPRKKRVPAHDMARRLEAVRERSGLRLSDFRGRPLEDGDYDVSCQAVQNYHFDRPAPIAYLAKVAKVFEGDFT